MTDSDSTAFCIMSQRPRANPMREVFKGWRRKVGCVTLMMACAVFGLWMRSHFLIEICEISVREREHAFGSFHGYLSWRSWDGSTDRSEVWHSLPAQTISPEILLDLEKAAAQSHARQWVIPHAVAVAALTILSAYLILWKPRKGTEPDHA